MPLAGMLDIVNTMLTAPYLGAMLRASIRARTEYEESMKMLQRVLDA